MTEKSGGKATQESPQNLGKAPEARNLSVALSSIAEESRKSLSEPKEQELTPTSQMASEGPRIDWEQQEAMREGGRLFNQSSCPQRHVLTAWKDCRGVKWHKTAEKLFSNLRKVDGFSAMFLGDRGPGKTQMAVFAVRFACIHLQWQCKYVKTVEMLMTLKQGFDTGKAEIDTLKPFMAPQLLVLDELQDRIEGVWSNQILTYLFDKRYDAMKSTILIANVNGSEESVRACIGSSIYDRLFECGEVINFDWPSFRGTVNGGIK